ncbi:MAG TPA: TetR/AcrR family transcriptional regulator [Caldithrix abyssi]|uniref:TetR/AcrR family transcriptional regulator n=1 Tax=Caldithrix abyssi TaxID=187145 RepID=A0A7V1LNR4_CALAY|nr:TetR/AcrR family transcriptional regulator [Caldithrix abyssi]
MSSPHLDRKDAHILKSAVTVIAEKGFEASSMREIARKAGVSTKTLYHRFHSKRQLLDSLLESIWQALADGTMEIRDNPQTDPLEKIDAVVDLFIAVFSNEPERALLFVRSYQPALKDESDSLKAHYVYFLKAFAEIIQKGIDQQYIHIQIDPRAFIFFIYGGMRSVLHEWALSPGLFPLESLRDSIKYQIKHGVLHW